jgi:hypothetical protein
MERDESLKLDIIGGNQELSKSAIHPGLHFPSMSSYVKFQVLYCTRSPPNG